MEETTESKNIHDFTARMMDDLRGGTHQPNQSEQNASSYVDDGPDWQRTVRQEGSYKPEDDTQHKKEKTKVETQWQADEEHCHGA